MKRNFYNFLTVALLLITVALGETTTLAATVPPNDTTKTVTPPYIDESLVNPQGPAAGSKRVIRGGRWGCPTRFCRVSYRRGTDPEIPNGGIGFRLAHP